MRERFRNFMQGRNGNDQLNYFLMIVDLVLILLGSIFRGTFGSIMYTLVLVILAVTYFRMFSKNVYKRSEENGRFIRLKYNFSATFRLYYERWVQRKDYKFFSCPDCKTTLRVPRGKGKISIVCRKCGHSFTGKT